MTAAIHQFRHHNLREGDVVRLRSGGPYMLVAVSDGEIERKVMCVWMAGRRMQTAPFDHRALEIVARQR